MFQPLKNLFFPKICFACGGPVAKSQKQICIKCLNALPRNNFYPKVINPLEKVFRARIKTERVTAFLRFQSKGKVQKLIHQFKYKGNTELGVELGELAANELMAVGFFEGIDLLIPMPIHALKREKRGFNQSDFIAKGIHQVTEIPINENCIKKNVNTSSQTRKGRFKRWKNVKTTFEITDAEALKAKHILLIDDVITTGATIEACSEELLKLPELKISILSIGFTY